MSRILNDIESSKAIVTKNEFIRKNNFLITQFIINLIEDGLTL